MTGTIIHATLRPEDLIPAFIEALSERLEATSFELGADATILVENHAETQAMLGQIELEVEQEGFYESDTYWVLELLFDALDGYAPEGYRFGAHECDGSDFGFWPIEEEES